MSSANNSEYGDLEHEFRRRMHDAESSPAPDLWARIDHDLTVQENKQYKDRIVLYRHLAAACFVLFMLTGSLLAYVYKDGFGVEKAGTILHDARVSYSQVEQAELPVSSGIAQATEADASNNIEADEAAAVKDIVIEKVTMGSSIALKPVSKSQTATATSAAGASASEESHASSSEKQSAMPLSLRQAITSVPAADIADRQTAQTGASNSAALPSSIKQLNDIYSKSAPPADKQASLNSIALNTSPDSRDSDRSGKSDSRWSVSMAYMPSYFNQNIGVPENIVSTASMNTLAHSALKTSFMTPSNVEAAQEEYEQNTTPAFSYTAEVKTGVRVSRKLKILSGLGFSQHNARTKSSYIVEQFSTNPLTNTRYQHPASTIFAPALDNSFSTDSISVQKTNEFTTNYRYNYLSVPIGLQYDGAISKHWYWYATGGVAANILMQTSILASHNQVEAQNYNRNDDASPFRDVQFSGNVGLGVGKRISETVAVSFGPEFKSFFSPMLANPDRAPAPQGKPYAIGLNLGVNYALGRKQL
ncbi:outer membrane beta-barrel protein [Pontibacter sp. SGAir0037]|uniref:outer membrane beta-barrel protein n=1 Tax=Pontibacter sp. SGAir0037 TaxID=2571030 RepID=UPI0010CCBB39|nr:outer membrane beta-barrel protein [Pontibacter sp. SGAir0037]QCR23628.1 PorT family protein [Pontibacter sp. SGAir0037]